MRISIEKKIVTTQKTQIKPSFKSVDSFTHIKEIPGMVCAICGKPTLSTEKYTKVIVPLSRSLAYNMSKGVLDYLSRKYPDVWAQLESLAQKYPKESLDEILTHHDVFLEFKNSIVKTLEPIPVPVDTPERIELDRSIAHLFYNTVDNARSFMKSSSVVMKQLMELKPFLTGAQKDVFEQFEIYSRKYPNKSLTEIINIPEIFQFHHLKNLLQRAETREQLEYRFDNILNLVKKENPKAVEYFMDLKEKTLEMFEEERNERIRAYKAEEIYSEALKEHGCAQIEKEVLEELSLVPKTFQTKDSFFDHAHSYGYTDGRILSALFGRILASEDHVEAVSSGGVDKVENKIVAHRSCNSIRKSIPYKEFLKYYPEMLEALQSQMNIITSELLKGNLPSFLRFYPIKVAETLYKESEAKINLDVSEYCTKSIEQSIERVNENDKKVLECMSSKKNQEQEIPKLTESTRKERNLQRQMQDYLKKR